MQKQQKVKDYIVSIFVLYITNTTNKTRDPRTVKKFFKSLASTEVNLLTRKQFWYGLKWNNGRQIKPEMTWPSSHSQTWYLYKPSWNKTTLNKKFLGAKPDIIKTTYNIETTEITFKIIMVNPHYFNLISHSFKVSKYFHYQKWPVYTYSTECLRQPSYTW